MKLTIWDTAGQEKFRTLTNTFYRGAKGIIFVYDVTRPQTLADLKKIWMEEIDMYGTEEDAVKMLIASKVDLVSGAAGREGARAGQGCGAAWAEGGPGRGKAPARGVSRPAGSTGIGRWALTDTCEAACCCCCWHCRCRWGV